MIDRYNLNFFERKIIAYKSSTKHDLLILQLNTIQFNSKPVFINAIIITNEQTSRRLNKRRKNKVNNHQNTQTHHKSQNKQHILNLESIDQSIILKYAQQIILNHKSNKIVNIRKLTIPGINVNIRFLFVISPGRIKISYY